MYICASADISLRFPACPPWNPGVCFRRMLSHNCHSRVRLGMHHWQGKDNMLFRFVLVWHIRKYTQTYLYLSWERDCCSVVFAHVQLRPKNRPLCRTHNQESSYYDQAFLSLLRYTVTAGSRQQDWYSCSSSCSSSALRLPPHLTRGREDGMERAGIRGWEKKEELRGNRSAIQTSWDWEKREMRKE